mgnify:FL=1
MITIVKYEALKNANKILQSTIDSDILYKFQQTLTEIYEWLEIEEANHQCFDSSMSILTDIQSDSVKPIEAYMKLATIIPIIIERFSSAEDDEIRKLKDFINNFFQTETIGLLPFVYKEIQRVNDESNGKYDLRIQGYTKAGDYYLITAYDHNHSLNSRVYIYDKTGKCIGYIELQNKHDQNAHVGGVAYDEENNIVFITGEDGVVNTYRLGDITEAANQVSSNTSKVPSISSNKVLQAIEFGNVDISSHFGDETSATTTYYSESENALYVADCAGDGSLIKYSVTVGGKGVSFDKGTVISRNFASCCQGVATYTDSHGNNYIYASQSYGANHDSVIKKYEIIDTGLKEVGATTIDTPGLEGIQIDKQGNLSGVFENFKDTDNPNQTININVNTIDFSKPLSETNPELEEFYIEMGTKNKEKLN